MKKNAFLCFILETIHPNLAIQDSNLDFPEYFDSKISKQQTQMTDNWFIEFLILQQYEQTKIVEQKNLVAWFYQNMHRFNKHKNYLSLVDCKILTEEEAKNIASQMLKDELLSIEQMKLFLQSTLRKNPLVHFPEKTTLKQTLPYFQKFIQRVDAYTKNQRKDHKKFGHYRILSELGRGGMGVVHKAIDTKLNRFVALKVITNPNIDHSGIKRFLQEIKAITVLQHPNIIQLYDSGQEPQMYFVMEYIEGVSLAQKMNEKQIEFQDSVNIIMKICSALEIVHNKKIIHRDIKPDNVMLTLNSEPKLMDFGLAKMVDEKNSLSQQGDILGTPFYMSPEQALCKPVDERTDVYSTGATLYEMLTGRPPVQGNLYVQIAYNVVSREPILPRTLNPDIPKELELICLKCLDKSPAKRYQSAQELHTDLENYLNGKPISIRLESLYRLKKWYIRNKLLSLVISILVCFIAVIAWFSYDKERINQQLQQQKKEKEVALKHAEKQLTKAHIKMAEYHFYQKTMHQANQEINTAKSITQNKSKKLKEYLYYFQKYSVEPNIPQKKREYTFPPNAKLFPQLNENYLSMIATGKTYIWKYSSLKKNKGNLDTGNAITFPFYKQKAFYKNTVTFCDIDYLVKVNLDTMQQQKYHLPGVEKCYQMAYSHNYVAVGFREEMWIYDLTNKKKFVFPTGRKRSAENVPLIFSQDGTLLLGRLTTHIGIWRLINKSQWKVQKQSFNFLGKKMYCLAMSSQKNQILYGDQKGNINIIEGKNAFADNLTISSVGQHSYKVNGIYYNKTSRLFVSVSRGFIIWDAISKKILAQHRDSEVSNIFDVNFNKNEVVLLVRKKGKLVAQFWAIEQKVTPLHLQDQKEVITLLLSQVGSASFLDSRIRISPQKKYAGITYKAAISIWERETNKNKARIDYDMVHISDYQFSHNEKYIIVSYAKGRIVVFDITNLKIVIDLKKHINGEYYQESAVAFSPDDKNIFFSIKTKKGFFLFNYNIVRKKIAQKIKLKSEISFCKLRQKTQLVVGDFEGRVHLFSIKNNLLTKSSMIDTDLRERIKQVLLTKNGNKVLIVIDKYKQVKIYKKENPKYILDRILPLKESYTFSSFSPNEEYLAMQLLDKFYLYNLKHDFKIEVAPGYSKEGLATISKDWSLLVFPSATGMLTYDLNFK
ncbi:protein kinase [Candidatus Uabimicrobium sp. HlEnr_7]|uniref:serine/threonine protein kinase n=1 Tax=Candidatus Uabimicrobium helgolandensis TaxID=3095367 RepID=UPI003556B1D6